jgi:hypothetical protein
MRKQSCLLNFRYLFLLILATLACTSSPFSSPTPTPRPEPPAGAISYYVPQYTRELQPGDAVPGTRIEYVGPDGDAHEVKINGLSAIRQTGESLLWDGIISQGVYADYRLRLATVSSGFMQFQLGATGPVEIYIFNPEPEALDSLEGFMSPGHIRFANIPVQYGPIPPGGRIPGTTLVFEEVTRQGVRLSGTELHPYWSVGDAIQWQGQLRNNVLIRLRMPITAADDRGLRLGGEAELWVIPPAYTPPRS